MKILGIDPGETTGWCLYETDGYVVAAGEFARNEIDVPLPLLLRTEVVVIERPVGQGPTRPTMVECGIVYGMLRERFGWPFVFGGNTWSVQPNMLRDLTRAEVRKALSDATYGTVRVTNDATAWAALVAIHGHDSDRKPKKKNGIVVAAGGPLGEVKGHARAALAVAVAWWLRRPNVEAAS